jgi:hypothetical protein
MSCIYYNQLAVRLLMLCQTIISCFKFFQTLKKQNLIIVYSGWRI